MRCGRSPCRCDVSPIDSATLNRLHPESYLRALLSEIAEHPLTRAGALLLWKLVNGVTTTAAHEYVPA